MKTAVLLIGLAALAVSAVSADAKQRRYYDDDAWDEEYVSYEDDDAYYIEDDNEEIIILNPRRRSMREAEQRVDEELWWLEERAQKRLEKRKNIRKTEKPVSKKAKTVAAKPKAAKVANDEVKTASLSKAPVINKVKPVSLSSSKTDLQKPKTPAKTANGKSIGCTAGAAVITGYGFGDVKPKVCTGATYAYSAARAGKAYEIKLTAASGEITDVKKLN
jgi:hypothetical protein